MIWRLFRYDIIYITCCCFAFYLQKKKQLESHPNYFFELSRWKCVSQSNQHNLNILQSTPFRRGSIYLLVIQLLCSSKLYVSSKTPHKTKKSFTESKYLFYFQFVFCYYMTCCYCRIDFLFVKHSIQFKSSHWPVTYYIFCL